MKAEVVREYHNAKDIFNLGHHHPNLKPYHTYVGLVRCLLSSELQPHLAPMCLWLLTACLGLLPSNPSPIIVVPAVPAPILIPTTAATTAATAATTTMSPAPTTTRQTIAAPTTAATTAASTAAPTTAAPTTVAPTTAAPTTAAPTTAAPTTAAPTTAATTAATTTRPATTGSIPIDPRLGTTPASSAALQVAGYSAQVPSYHTTVRFPRQKRNIGLPKGLNMMKDFIMQNKRVDQPRRKRATCSCVPAGTCVKVVSNSGAAMIDVRIVTPVSQCPTGQEYCCTDSTTTTPIACGTLQTVANTGVTPGTGQANYGEFPWQVIVLTKQNDYLAGGVLIDSLNVLTVTHRLVSYVVSGTAPNVKVRLGEWDAAGTYEPIPFQEYTVAKVFTHPSYNPNTLQYDITVLRLSSAVPFTPTAGSVATINRACLPMASTTTYNGQRCFVAGWGKNMFGVNGQYQQILKKVAVPIVAPATCQTQLQTARLGSGYVLDTTSFVCAGGEANMDSCTGDGGSGLVCQVNSQWVVVGLVAWGLGCASANVPAAYVNVAALLPWIQQQVATA